MTGNALNTILIVLLSSSLAAIADSSTDRAMKEAENILNQARARAKTRKLASIDRNRASEFASVRGASRSESPIKGSLGIKGGFSSLQNSRSSAPEQTMGLGAEASLTLYRYVGIDAEGTQTFRLKGETAETRRSLMPNLRGQIPFETSTITIVPHVGLGYGFIGFKNGWSPSPTLIGGVNNDYSLEGAYAVAGITFGWDRFSLTGDFLRSISTTGTQQEKLGAITNTYSISGSKFSRLRIGLNYRFSDNFYSGVCLTQRSIDLKAMSTTQTQFLGSVGLEF